MLGVCSLLGCGNRKQKLLPDIYQIYIFDTVEFNDDINVCFVIKTML